MAFPPAFILSRLHLGKVIESNCSETPSSPSQIVGSTVGKFSQFGIEHCFPNSSLLFCALFEQSECCTLLLRSLGVGSICNFPNLASPTLPSVPFWLIFLGVPLLVILKRSFLPITAPTVASLVTGLGSKSVFRI